MPLVNGCPWSSDEHLVTNGTALGHRVLHPVTKGIVFGHRMHVVSEYMPSVTGWQTQSMICRADALALPDAFGFWMLKRSGDRIELGYRLPVTEGTTVLLTGRPDTRTMIHYPVFTITGAPSIFAG